MPLIFRITMNMIQNIFDSVYTSLTTPGGVL